nr:MAG TPA: PLK4, STIL-box, Complex, transferase.6A [Caudoviricetes sp.]
MIKDLPKEILKEQKKQTKLLQEIKVLLKQQVPASFDREALTKDFENRVLELSQEPLE